MYLLDASSTPNQTQVSLQHRAFWHQIFTDKVHKALIFCPSGLEKTRNDLFTVS